MKARWPLLLIAFTAPATAQDSDKLAQQLSNPIASLISVPLQFNYDDGLGAGGDGERFTLNIQPVIPVALSEDWNLISRTIVPLVSQDDVFPDGSDQGGLGDIVQSVFFSPAAPTQSGWVWGAGPVFLLPSATDDRLGGEQWALGPTAVALKQTASGLTVGVLFNHLWSVAGDDDRADISNTLLQPFISKGLGQGRTLSLNLESTYDWHNDRATVPLNLGYSKVGRIGTQIVSWQGGIRYYIESPDNGAEWGLRFTFTLLYPRK
jgi:hypothetical protein